MSGAVLNSTVVTGDGNVVLQVDGKPFAEVAAPRSVAEADRLLFAVESRLGVGVPSQWLRPEAGIVAVQPRVEVDALAGWCGRLDRGPLVRLLCGQGGQGKTHAARQVCSAMRTQGWHAGFVMMPPVGWRGVGPVEVARAGADRAGLERGLRRVPELIAGIRAVPALGMRVLLVVDYAENVGPLVGELVDTIVEAGAEDRVRVLLLARSADGWYADVARHRPVQVAPAPLWLASLPAQVGADRSIAVWRQAMGPFASRACDDGILTPADVQRLGGAQPGGNWETALDLYADAALRALDLAHPEVRGGAEGDPVAGVLMHERHQVDIALTAAGCALDARQRDWALAVVCLRTAPTLAAAEEALAAVPGRWRVPDGQISTVAATLRSLYPDVAQVWAPPRPDRVADTHLLDVAATLSEDDWNTALVAVCGSVDRVAAVHAVTVLLRCLSTPTVDARQLRAQGRIVPGLGWLLAQRPATFVAALTLLAPETFSKQIVEALTSTVGDPAVVGDKEVEQLDALLRGIGFTTNRTRIAVAVAERAVAAGRPHNHAEPRAVSRYANSLSMLGLRLSELGRRQEALAPTEEAAAYYQQLAEANPAAYLPNLATALNNLAARLDEVGSTREAHTIRRELDELPGSHSGATRPREHGRKAARSKPAWRAWLNRRSS